MNIINLRVVRQTFDFDCGAKALQAVMEYYGVDIREDELMEALGTDETGTPVAGMISLAGKKGFEVFTTTEASLDQLKQFVDHGCPPIVLVQAWAERVMTLEDWKADYKDGHYVIVIGYQDHIMIFEDPASFRRTWLSEDEFLARWHDFDSKTNAKLERFMMVLLGKEPAGRAVEHMD